MQDPNADTEWNDVLRAKGILPPKVNNSGDLEITEEAVVNLIDQRIAEGKKEKSYEDMTLEEIEALEDEEDERVLQAIRQQRMAELQEKAKKGVFGDVREISAEDYKQQVNGAGEGVWVVLHLYKSGIPLCSLINQFLVRLCSKYPQIKFLKSVSTVCIPNFPDRNLPAIFVYFEGELKTQLVGPLAFGGMNMKIEDLEFKLNKAGVPTDVKENPRPPVEDVMMKTLKQSKFNADDDSEDDNDW